MSRFNEGDIVRIAKNSRYYNDHNDFNPRDMDGTFLENDRSDTINLKVEWENGETAWYAEKDLKLRKRA